MEGKNSPPLDCVAPRGRRRARALRLCAADYGNQGRQVQVPLPRVKFLPGNDRGVANVQGIVAVEHFRLGKRAGEFYPEVLAKVREALAYFLELHG